MRLDSGAFLFVFAAYFLVYSAVPQRPKRVLLVVGSVAFTRRSVCVSSLFSSLWASSPSRSRPAFTGRPPSAREGLLGLGVGANVLTLVVL